MMVYLLVFFYGVCFQSFVMCFCQDWAQQRVSFCRRSRCDICEHHLSWIEIIPIIGFFWNHGHCRYCHNRISMIYPLNECLLGMVFTFLYFFQQDVMILAIFSILIMMAHIDYYAQWVPDILQVFLALSILLLMPSLEQYGFSIMILCVLLLISLLVPGGLGGADIKCLSLLALFLPMTQFPLLLLSSSFLAIFHQYFYRIFFKKSTQPLAIPFIPYFCVGFFFSMLIK